MDPGVELLSELCIHYIKVISDPTVAHQHMQLYLKQTLSIKNTTLFEIHSFGVNYVRKNSVSNCEPFSIFPQAQKSRNTDVIKLHHLLPLPLS